MEKVLDLKKTVAELVKEFPEFQQAMAEIGFKEILNPIALEVMGRVMTLPKGAAVKGIPLETVLAGLKPLPPKSPLPRDGRKRCETSCAVFPPENR